MSKIRTLDDLSDAMSKEFAWRKKELHTIKMNVHSSRNTGGKDTAIRGGITLLYAHWEGFVKNISVMYLEFICSQKISNRRVVRSLLSLSAGKVIDSASLSGKYTARKALVDFFHENMKDDFSVNYKTAVKTKSNLKSDVFRDIVCTLGLDYSLYELKEKIIDEKLVFHRNEIAHGQYLIVSYDEYMDIFEEVLSMMQTFYNQVSNASLRKEYLSQPVTE